MVTLQTAREAIDAEVEGETVLSRLLTTVEGRPGAVALRWRTAEGWETLSWRQYLDGAAELAAGLAELGVRRGDRVVLMLRNRPEFHLADIAILLLGAVPISTFVTSPAPRLAQICRDTDARAIVVDDRVLATLAAAVSAEVPSRPTVVVVDDPEGRAPASVRHWASLTGTTGVDAALAAERTRPSDPATIVFTSGTTGRPKGAMLTHGNICWTVASSMHVFGTSLAGWSFLSYLPMAHIAERIEAHYGHIDQGADVATCPSPGLLGQYLPEVRPRLFVGVPQVWIHIKARLERAAAADPAGQRQFAEALRLGERRLDARLTGHRWSAGDEQAWAQADREILAVVRMLAGLDGCEVAVTTSGPLPERATRFFLALGVPLSELYGMTETCGPMTWNPHDPRPGVTGPPIPGCEIEVADDGEILARGGNVFPGYLGGPDETLEVIDGEGWLHTGDVGAWAEGGLRIVGRKKQLIITTAGEHAAPEALEAALRMVPLVDQACVVGDGRPYVAALLTLDPETAPAWAAEHGGDRRRVADLAADPAVVAEVGRGVKALNATLAKGERIRRFHVLGDTWAQDSDVLTATLKPRRQVIEARYASEIVSLYA